jgi:hypothetical protein
MESCFIILLIIVGCALARRLINVFVRFFKKHANRGTIPELVIIYLLLPPFGFAWAVPHPYESYMAIESFTLSAIMPCYLALLLKIADMQRVRS